MATLTLTWPQVALLVFLVLAVYAAEMLFFHWRLRRHQFAERLLAARLQNIEKSVEELRRALQDTGREETRPPSAAGPTRPEPMRFAVPYPPPEPPPAVAPATAPKAEAPWNAGAVEEGATPYAQAIELARRGADAARLARDCGLSRGEADLIVSLYGRSVKK